MECITKSLEFAAGASRTLRLLSARKGAKRVVVDSCPRSRPAPPPRPSTVLYHSNSYRVPIPRAEAAAGLQITAELGIALCMDGPNALLSRDSDQYVSQLHL
jgi:hypothetical protein